MRGLHNYIMVYFSGNCRCIAYQQCHGRTRGFAPTESIDDAFEIDSATDRMYPAPTGCDDGAVGFGAPGGRALRW